MSSLITFLRMSCKVLRPSQATFCQQQFWRLYADTSKPNTPANDVNNKSIVVQGMEKSDSVRVRRARPADLPRIVRFVREHARTTWPDLLAEPPSAHVVLADYVARTVAQGHSMLAEQVEMKRGWAQIRGLALATAVCPWDGPMLERWARSLRCSHARKLMNFTAHCLQAPALHHKYRVHKILQVVMIVPPDSTQGTELVQVLVKHATQRGKDAGFPLIRFDVTNDNLVKSLEAMDMTKEWKLLYEVMPDEIKAKDTDYSDSKGSSKESDPQVAFKAKQPELQNTVTVFSKQTEF